MDVIRPGREPAAALFFEGSCPRCNAVLLAGGGEVTAPAHDGYPHAAACPECGCGEVPFRPVTTRVVRLSEQAR